jgi:predicted phosphodiesterase
MKVDIFSDLHLDHWMAKVYKDRRARAVLREFVRAGRSDADVIIFAGDAGNGYNWYEAVVAVLEEEYETVIATPGNHDFYRTPGYTDEHFVEGETAIGRFAACPLWTNFRNKEGFGVLAQNSISDWLYVPELVNYDRDLVDAPWKITAQEYMKYRAQLMDCKPEIAVTHFAPIVQSIHPMYAGDALNTYFCNDDEKMFNAVDPLLWVHGHTHSEMDYTHNDTRVIAHPIGYPYENYSELIGIPMKTIEV